VGLSISTLRYVLPELGASARRPYHSLPSILFGTNVAERATRGGYAVHSAKLWISL
jgi:hypothetical protein